MRPSEIAASADSSIEELHFAAEAYPDLVAANPILPLLALDLANIPFLRYVRVSLFRWKYLCEVGALPLTAEFIRPSLAQAQDRHRHESLPGEGRPIGARYLANTEEQSVCDHCRSSGVGSVNSRTAWGEDERFPASGYWEYRTPPIGMSSEYLEMPHRVEYRDDTYRNDNTRGITRDEV